MKPTDREMVALGEALAEAVQDWRERAGDAWAAQGVSEALRAWDDAMADRFMSAIEDIS